MFDSDRPILKSVDDLLNRGTFAKYLARCLLDHKEPESLVVGLQGSWGSGKTSLINLIVEELQFAASNLEDPEKPVILNFSAWSYSGHTHLIYSFFRRLSSALRQAEFLENRERIVELLELYVSFFTNKPVPKALRMKKKGWKHWFQKSTESVSGWESGQDLTLVKAELNRLLSMQKHKIIIMIDNVSRLLPHEITQVFQIMKSMGDYVNTVYLFAYDERQILHALDELHIEEGDSYLGKWIQLRFDLPKLTHRELETLLSHRLESVIALMPEEAWNKNRWSDVFAIALRYFFTEKRDITRFINRLNFSYPRVKDVVNPVDYFAITVIEMFEPVLYHAIKSNKDLFTDLTEHVYQRNESHIEKDQERVEEILSRDLSHDRNKLIKLLVFLFPRLNSLYYPLKKNTYNEGELIREKRISSYECFDAYFRLSIDTHQIPQSEWMTLLAAASNATQFDETLTRLNQDNMILDFLSVLDDEGVIEKLPLDYLSTIIHALLDNADLFPREEGGKCTISTAWRIHRIIELALLRYEEKEARGAILIECVNHVEKSLMILIHECEFYASKPESLLDKTSIDSLKMAVLNKIQEWKESGRLINHPQLMKILLAWRDWTSDQIVSVYLDKAIQNDRDCVTLLLAAFEKPINDAMTKYHKAEAWYESLEQLSKLINLQKCLPRVISLFEDNYFMQLKEKEQLAILIFLDLMKQDVKKELRQYTEE